MERLEWGKEQLQAMEQHVQRSNEARYVWELNGSQ